MSSLCFHVLNVKPGHEEDLGRPLLLAQSHKEVSSYSDEEKKEALSDMLPYYLYQSAAKRDFCQSSDLSRLQMECLQEEKLSIWQSMET